MSDFESIFESATAFLEESEEQVFTWQGIDYTCTAANVSHEKDYADNGAGYRVRAALTVEASIDQFSGAYPQPGDPIQHGGSDYVFPHEHHIDAVSINFRAYKA